MKTSNQKAESTRTVLMASLKKPATLAFILAGLVVLLVWYTRPSMPPKFPPDPSYKLPDKARFLPPETQELLRDALSRIKPVDPNDKSNYEKGRKFAKQAFDSHLKLRRVMSTEETKYCIDNAIATTNLDYYGNNVYVLAYAVNDDYRKYTQRWRREYIEAANVLGDKIGNISSALHGREFSYWELIQAIVYHRVAEFDNKFEQKYNEHLHAFQKFWEVYLRSLKKGLSLDYGNLIREGSYEKTINHIDDIFTNMKHIPKPNSYREFEFHGHEGGGETKPPKPMMSEEERQEKLSVVLDALQYDIANPWDKIGAYDDFANLMGGFNYMINDPFLNQIMIFSTRQHIFEKAAEREKSISGEGSFIHKKLLEEAGDAEYIKSHYELLYKEEGKKLPEFLQKE